MHFLSQLHNLLFGAPVLEKLAALVEHLIETAVAFAFDDHTAWRTGWRMTAFWTGMHTSCGTRYGTSLLTISTARLLLHVIQFGHWVTD